MLFSGLLQRWRSGTPYRWRWHPFGVRNVLAVNGQRTTLGIDGHGLAGDFQDLSKGIAADCVSGGRGCLCEAVSHHDAVSGTEVFKFEHIVRHLRAQEFIFVNLGRNVNRRLRHRVGVRDRLFGYQD